MALIKSFKTGSKTSHRQLAALYYCGRAQVAESLERKAEIMSVSETNKNSQSKRLKSGTALEMQAVDSMPWDWFTSKSLKTACTGVHVYGVDVPFGKDVTVRVSQTP